METDVRRRRPDAQATNSSTTQQQEQQQGGGGQDEAGESPQPHTKDYENFLSALIRGGLIFAISIGVNILNFMVYLVVRPWSRITARRIVGKCYYCCRCLCD